jgi:hypothetical protein
VSKITELGSFYVSRLSLTPYMGSGSKMDNGYLMVPDGSGALINFNNGKEKSDKFSMMVYGDDPSLAGEMNDTNTKTAALPVFGINRNQTGLLGVIVKGDASTRIEALVSGQRNSCNTVYADFILRNRDTVVVGESGLTQTKQVIKYDEHRLSEDCAVRYYPLDKGCYNYSDMAQKYKKFLIAQGMKRQPKDNAIPLFAEVYGGTYKQKTYFGLTFNSYQVLTDYNNIETIRSDLSHQGSNDTVLLYRQWSSDEAKYKIQNKIRPAGDLGSINAFRKLLKTEGDNLYLSFSPLTVKKSGNGFWQFLNTAKRLSKEPALLYSYKLSTHYKDLTVNPSYLPELNSLSMASKGFIDSAKDYDVKGIYLPDFGSLLYTNFDDTKYASRGDLKLAIEQIMDGYNGKITVKSPNEYTLKYADSALDLPSGSSGFDVEDEEIPFYQLAVSGLVSYSLDAVNLSSNPRRVVLQSIETGASLYFVWIGQNASVLSNTTLNNLYGADYSLWKSYAVSAQKEIKAAFDSIGTRIIVSHEWLAKDVSRTVFENGKSVIVNYTQVPVETAYGKVAANGYLLS